MIPPPLFKQLVLALLVGTGCFLFSILFYFCTGDCILLILGTVLFLGSISNGLSLYQLIKKKTYYCLEGMCIYRYRLPMIPEKSTTCSFPKAARSRPVSDTGCILKIHFKEKRYPTLFILRRRFKQRLSLAWSCLKISINAIYRILYLTTSIYCVNILV